MVGETAVREGDIGPSLENNDLGFFIHPAQPGCRAGSASHTANDNDLHKALLKKSKDWNNYNPTQ